ncbi:dTDP-4-dehydrorhamnose 3,5-epimerase [Evansella tamaricis]|uniref:dTDP-4-dehydrorhamnose 3,5-epimerase n=1 Tax=Evansella tamaricis TaxID=2069301 RepID=A0ABS6JI86_9BACI|nr:dTDP-4-dehydrorhamnose 3,5-epimerase [Evansella tamaricis]MBU9712175.1 dTDP-4-dehydrorhamnose 3,5-epimerase [Evansella tamaricis]
MKVTKTFFNGEVKLITPKAHYDDRGFFMETYQYEKLTKYKLNTVFSQDNHSMSYHTGTIRGLHYQLPPMAQTKLVRVIRGAIFDVVVDIRKSSSTFGEWIGVELSSDNKKQLYIPKGFAHGFCTKMDNTEVIYKVDANYSRTLERGILWNDSNIGISWPKDNTILSDKDKNHPLLKDADVFV